MNIRQNNRKHAKYILDAEVFVSIKYLSSFWGSFDLPLIKCEIKLNLRWTKIYVISEISIMPRIPGNPDANPPA